ncbi:hypothetical protein TNCV_1378991 [Trichonephila clavipes]|nr:hypothetical protein TNCV_1378991 [Trichonephila clavipes]
MWVRLGSTDPMAGKVVFLRGLLSQIRVEKKELRKKERPEKKDKGVRERERTEGGETEKRERRRKETERESGRERVKPALNGEKG